MAARYDRLTASDASFLHLENPTAPMQVGSLGIFEGGPFLDDGGRFRIEDARGRIASRLHLVPRFRKRLMTVPLQQGRPVWVDDEGFDLAYHVRLTALPKPGNEEQLKALMGRLQSQLLDRRRPLWELWFVEGLEGGRVAIIQKTHHALVDGISGVDVATVILDLEPDPPPVEVPPWEPERAPEPFELLLDSVIERTTTPAEVGRSLRAAVRGPRRVVDQAAGVARVVTAAARPTAAMPWNVPVGPQRRFEVVRADLAVARRAKSALGGTVNDVVLSVVAGGLRSYLLRRGEEVPDDLTVRTMVPVSVRDDSERMQLGNRVSAMFADLPVGTSDPVARLRSIAEQMRAVKESEQAVSASLLVSAAEYASPTLLSLAARLLPFQRSISLGVTNIPGPQVPLYCMGARMLEAFPYVGVISSVALMVAILSYDGTLGFGLTGDRDAVPDLAALAEEIGKAMAELAEVL